MSSTVFVRRESSIPFANRMPTLRFNNNSEVRNISEEGVVHEDNVAHPLAPPPLKSSLKPSNFLHPILVASLQRSRNRQHSSALGQHINPYATSVTPRNSTLCVVINVKLIGSVNSVEELARTAMDLMTFPVPYTGAIRVDIFARLKCIFTLIVTSMSKLRQGPKTPDGKSSLFKDAKLHEIFESLLKTKKNIKLLRTSCGALATFTHNEFASWSKLVHGMLKAQLHSGQKDDYRLYSDLTLPLGPDDFKSYEEVTGLNCPNLHVSWTRASLRLEEPNLTFDQLSPKCQLEMILELTRLSELIVDQSRMVMEGCLDRWETDYSSLQLRAGYESIRDEIEEVKLDKRPGACLYYELKSTMELLNIRKLDLVKASAALVTEIKSLLKVMKRVTRFVEQTYSGRSEIEKKNCCACCNPLVDVDVLTKILVPGENWGITMTMPLHPDLIDLIDLCTPKKEEGSGDLEGFVEIPLGSDTEEGDVQ